MIMNDYNCLVHSLHFAVRKGLINSRIYNSSSLGPLPQGFPRAGRPRSTDAPRSVSAGETLPSKALQGRCPTLKAISILASKEPQASVGGHVSVSGCTLMSAPTFSQNINENIRTQVMQLCATTFTLKFVSSG